MSPSKVTVLIPTRERPDTLAKSLRTALNQDYPNLEIVVSDNDSSAPTADVVRGLNDPRIRYLNTGRRLSMSHNWEFALSHISEGWIACIGDDDGLLPNSLGRPVSLLEQTGCEVLQSINCHYHWPERQVPGHSILSVPMRKGHRIADAKDFIRSFMQWRVGKVMLPMFYTGGMVRAELMQRIKQRTGTFFHSQIPDYYSAFALCSVIDKYVASQEPFAIAGASKHSTGAATLAMGDSPFLREDNIPWHADIPMTRNGTLTFSIPAIGAECYLQSGHLHGNFLGLKPIDLMKLIVNRSVVGRDMFDDEWRREFARRNGMDWPVDLSDGPLTRARAAVESRIDMLRNYLSRYRVDQASNLAVNDVFEASLVGDSILKLRPGVAKSYVRTARRKIASMRSPRAAL